MNIDSTHEEFSPEEEAWFEQGDPGCMKEIQEIVATAQSPEELYEKLRSVPALVALTTKLRAAIATAGDPKSIYASLFCLMAQSQAAAYEGGNPYGGVGNTAPTPTAVYGVGDPAVNNFTYSLWQQGLGQVLKFVLDIIPDNQYTKYLEGAGIYGGLAAIALGMILVDVFAHNGNMNYNPWLVLWNMAAQMGTYGGSKVVSDSFGWRQVGMLGADTAAIQIPTAVRQLIMRMALS